MKTAVFPKDKQASYEAYGYSAAIRSNDLVFVSGQVGVDHNGVPISDSQAQIEGAFESLSQILEAADCTFDDIVDVTSYHVDMYRYFDTFAAVKQRFFPTPPYPSWTAVGVTNLMLPELIVEIKAVARPGVRSCQGRSG